MEALDADQVVSRLPELVNADPALVARGRLLSTHFLLGVGAVEYLVRVAEGRLVAVERGPFLLRSWSFAVRAAADAWARFWEPVPAPGYHDLFAMRKRGLARVEGDLGPLMTHLRYVKDVLAAPRRLARPPAAPPGAARGPRGAGGDRSPARIEPIVGRYLRLALDGRPYRVYFETAGEGPPLLCLHTAGADGRQFRHLMLDETVTARWRVVAFDLPRHGKSLPAPGWQDEEYRLTADAYVALVLAVCEGLGLERPVVLGCSVGGKIVLELALRAPERFRALIGLEAAAYQAPWYDDTSWLHRPDVHGGEMAAALMSGLIAPQSPDEARWETLWMYAQSGPGVFRGDLHFYRVEGDLRDRVHRIDTGRCPLYLLTGEYDFSCSPEDTQATAALVPGARVTIMRELGHFPMSEDPARFRAYLLPVLDEIRRAGSA